MVECVRISRTIAILLIIALLLSPFVPNTRANEDDDDYSYRIIYTYEGTIISNRSFPYDENATIMNTTALDLGSASYATWDEIIRFDYHLNVKCIDHFTLEVTSSNGTIEVSMLNDVRLTSLRITVSITRKKIKESSVITFGAHSYVKFGKILFKSRKYRRSPIKDYIWSRGWWNVYVGNVSTQSPWLWGFSEDAEISNAQWPEETSASEETNSSEETSSSDDLPDEVTIPVKFDTPDKVDIFIPNNVTSEIVEIEVHTLTKAEVIARDPNRHFKDYASINTIIEQLVEEVMNIEGAAPKFLYFEFVLHRDTGVRGVHMYYILNIYKLHAPSEEIIKEKKEEEEVEREWTIMIYMAADNDLEPWALINLLQIEATMHDLCLDYNPQTVEDVKKFLKKTAIVVLIDRNPQDYEDIDIVKEFRLERVIDGYFSDWADSRILELDYNENEWIPLLVAFKDVEEWGEVNTGDPLTLTKFLKYATRKYPAPRYMLIIWDHGGGSEGVAFDDTDQDFLTLKEIRQAIEDSGVHIDILCFDACLMATIETAYEFMNVADYLVASEEAVFGLGWGYDYWIKPFVACAENNTRDLAIIMAQRFIDFYMNLSKELEEVIPATSSVLDLKLLRSSNIKHIMKNFVENVTGDETAIRNIRRIRYSGYIQSFGGGFHPISGSNHVDLIDLLLKIRETIGDSADKLLRLLNQVIVFNGLYSRSVAGARGVSIYYPMRYDRSYYTSINTFSTSTGWADLLDLLTNVEPELAIKEIKGKQHEVRIYRNSTFTTIYPGAVTSLNLFGDQVKEVLVYSVASDEQGQYHLIASLSKPSAYGMNEVLTHELDKGSPSNGEVPFTILKAIGADIDMDGLEEAILTYYYMNLQAEILYTSIDIYDYNTRKNSIDHYYLVFHNFSATAITVADINNDGKLELIMEGSKVDFTKRTITDTLYIVDVAELKLISEYEWPKGILSLEATKDNELIAVNTEWSINEQGGYSPEMSQIDILSYQLGKLTIKYSMRLNKVSITDISVSDLDFDGEQELALLLHSYDNTIKLVVYKLLKDGFKVLDEQTITISINPLYLNVGDIDGDGVIELLLTGIADDNTIIDIYSYTSRYGLIHEVAYRFRGSYCIPILTDVDLDYIQEVVLAMRINNEIYIMPYEVRNYVKPYGSLRGMVLDRDRRSVSGAIVIVVSTKGNRIIGSAETDENGYFAIYDIPAGTYEVDALWTEYVEGLEDIVMAFSIVQIPPGGVCEVALVEYVFTEDLHELLNIPTISYAYAPPSPAPEQIVTIHGYVTDNNGNPIKGAKVKVDGEVAITNDNGYYILNLTIGSEKYNLTISHEDYVTYESSINLEAGGIYSINFTLKKIPSESTPSRCLIVTAAYESEIAWPVQFLKSFRDEYVLKTISGRAFIDIFNKFYYSWSPEVAKLEWKYPILRSLIKVLLYPLIGSLMVSYSVYNALSLVPELAILIAGMIASLLIGLLYSLPITLILVFIRRRSLRPRFTHIIFTSCLLGAILLYHLLALLAKHYTLLQFSSTSIVLMSIVLGGILSFAISGLFKILAIREIHKEK